MMLLFTSDKNYDIKNVYMTIHQNINVFNIFLPKLKEFSK